MKLTWSLIESPFHEHSDSQPPSVLFGNGKLDWRLRRSRKHYHTIFVVSEDASEDLWTPTLTKTIMLLCRPVAYTRLLYLTWRQSSVSSSSRRLSFVPNKRRNLQGNDGYPDHLHNMRRRMHLTAFLHVGIQDHDCKLLSSVSCFQVTQDTFHCHPTSILRWMHKLAHLIHIIGEIRSSNR